MRSADPSTHVATSREAIDRAERNADDDWLTAANATVRRLAFTHDEFTTDDVWAVLDRLPVDTHERRALAAVMRRAARRGLIATTDRYTPSQRTACHGRPVRVWRSTYRARMNAF